MSDNCGNAFFCGLERNVVQNILFFIAECYILKFEGRTAEFYIFARTDLILFVQKFADLLKSLENGSEHFGIVHRCQNRPGNAHAEHCARQECCKFDFPVHEQVGAKRECHEQCGRKRVQSCCGEKPAAAPPFKRRIAIKLAGVRELSKRRCALVESLDDFDAVHVFHDGVVHVGVCLELTRGLFLVAD